jgi:hypothetical protein
MEAKERFLETGGRFFHFSLRGQGETVLALLSRRQRE